MGTPGSGLLASLRRKNKAPDPAVDESKFAARSAAVLAVEQAVATGAVPEPSPKFAKGVAIAPDGDFLFDLDETHEGEDQLDLKVRGMLYYYHLLVEATRDVLGVDRYSH